MTIIEAQVKDQVLTVTKDPLVASGGINETTVLFSFCENWTDFIKTAVFADAKKENWYDVPLDADNKAVVPAQVTAVKGRFWFGVIGIKDETRYTSKIVSYDVEEGAVLSGEAPDIPQSVVDKIMASINATNNAVTALEKRVKALEDNGGGAAEQGPPGEKGDPFTYEDFTEEQLADLKGDPFTYEDFTEEQLAELKGEPGYTPQKGIDYFDGEKGDPFTYEDFTEEQLADLKGKDGKDGVDGKDGKDADPYVLTEEDKADIVSKVLAEIPQTATYTGEVEVV